MISLDERQRLLAVARRAVVQFVAAQALPETPSPPTAERRGAFVTLHCAGRLRGCIGRLDSREPLDSLVATCAVLAASQDPRFDPLRAPELERLEVEVSVLAPAQEVAASEVLDRLQPGVHGLIVSLGSARGLLLPQVAAEQGWGAPKFLEETCRKAGLPAHAWREPGAKIELFTAEVFSEPEGRWPRRSRV